jgi:hypothetical protein
MSNFPIRRRILIVFGSAPLQMGVSPSLASGDVYIATREDIVSVLDAGQMLKGQSDPYVEVCQPDDFRCGDSLAKPCSYRTGSRNQGDISAPDRHSRIQGQAL